MHQPILLLILFLLLSTPGPAPAGEERTLKMPPASLAKWYKPVNKRQVWLHTMFRLRRQMQAVEEYVLLKDAAGVKKWGRRLAESYRRIPEMVPEWRDEVELGWADRLEAAALKGNFKGVARAWKKLENSCDACHDDFRPLAAALYRAPEYSKLKVMTEEAAGEITYPELMNRLTRLVNRIKIAIEDGRLPVAGQALKRLGKQLGYLGESCGQCHRDNIPRERILGGATRRLLKKLGASIRNNELKEAGKLLGKAAVAVCARCHGVHRTLGDLKEFLTPLR